MCPPSPRRNFDPDLLNFYPLISWDIEILDPPPPSDVFYGWPLTSFFYLYNIMYILLLILLLFYTFLLLPWQVNCKIMVKTVTLCWYHQVRCHFQQLLSQLGFFQEKKYAMLEKKLEKTNWNWGWLISGLIDGAQWAFHENWLWCQTKSNLHISICRTQIAFHISIWDTLLVVRIQMKTEAWLLCVYFNSTKA